MVAWQSISIFALVQILMLVGLLGLIVPLYPGLVIMWLAALGYGILSGFSTLGIVLFVIITLLMVVGSVGDNLLVGATTRKGGVPWKTIIIALVAGVAGTALLPPVGGIIAVPLVIMVMEYLRVRDWNQAWLALRGLATGWGLAYVVRLGFGFLTMILWWLWAWKG